jgi:hypothetical protein
MRTFVYTCNVCHETTLCLDSGTRPLYCTHCGCGGPKEIWISDPKVLGEDFPDDTKTTNIQQTTIRVDPKQRINIHTGGDKTIISLNKDAYLAGVTIICEDVGVPGIIGPDVEIDLTETVEAEKKEAKEWASMGVHQE